MSYNSAMNSAKSSSTSTFSKKDILTHFAAVDPIIHQVAVTMPLTIEKPIHDHGEYFARLSRAIVGQQLSGAAADTIYGRFLNLFGAPPTPSQIQATEDQHLRDVGLSWSKVSYLKNLADAVLTKKITLEGLHTRDSHQIITELTQVKGIGQWTVEMFLMFVLRRSDVFSYGDLGLLRGLQKLYGLGEKPQKHEIQNIIEPWSPYKTYGSMALWHSLNNR